MAQALTIEQIKRLIFEKEEAMLKLSFHRNNSLAVERWRDYQEELRMLRELANQYN